MNRASSTRALCALAALAASDCPGTISDPQLILDVRAASVCDAPTQVFAERCTGCHSPGPAEYANLDLTSPGVAKRVTGTKATCAGEILVVAGEPDASYLFTKLVEPAPPCGSQMPLNGMLSDDDLSCVQSWIVGLGNGGPPVDTSCGTNLDPAHATAISSAIQGCIATNEMEQHFYSLSAPIDGGGTYVVSLGDVGAGTLEEQVLFPDDGGGTEIVHATAFQPGQSLSVFFTAAPGETYWVAVFQVVTTSAPFSYSLQPSFTPTVDPFPASDTPQSAVPVVADTPTSAAFFAGYTSASPPSSADLGTWFQLQLQASPLTVTLTSCPADIRAEIDLTDSAGATVLATQSASNNGVSLTLDAGVASAGTYLLHVLPAIAPIDPPSGVGSTPPPYLGQLYTLETTQN